MQGLTSLLILLVVTVASLARLHHKSRAEISGALHHGAWGKSTPLSSFKGKVIVIEFLFLGSQHCMRVATTLNKLYEELGSRGLQPVGIAFGPDATAANTYLATKNLKLNYPVGYADTSGVDTYLARGKDEVLNVPQVIVIDREGLIRAQSGLKPGDPQLENEDSLRRLLQSLLNERPSSK